MTWDGAMTALDADLVLAAADVSPVVPLVREGEPDNLTQDTLAYWVDATRVSHTGGLTLGKVNIERGVTVVGYLRGSVRAGTIDSTLERRIVALEEALLIRLWSDIYMGGHAISIDIDGADYGWTEVAGTVARTLTLTVWLDLAEVASITT